jgi:G3E family GTPase
MKEIPVNIISGFLGSGKTTAIINLLKQKNNDEEWAVIINEFGKVSIDGQTLKSNSVAGSVFEISGGCICCSAKGYFGENLNMIIQTGNYSRIIIEPSGLGGIDMVSEIVAANPVLQLMPVICLVDILLTENPRLQMIQIYRAQIYKSSVIAFSKCDLLKDTAERERLTEQFKSAFPEKQDCIIQSENLFYELMNFDSILKKEENKYRMLFASNQDLTDSSYQEMNYQFGTDKIFDIEKLTQFFKNQPSIIRAKGFVQTKTGWNLFNYTLSGCTFEPCLPKSKSEMVVIAEKSEVYLQNLEENIVFLSS